MGWRYRKSIGKTFRINISKSGVGYSVGTKGFRITKTAKGTTRKTITIPGTGLSHVTEVSQRKKAYNSTSIKSGYNSTFYFTCFICLTLIISFSLLFTIVDAINTRKEQEKMFNNCEITFITHNFVDANTPNAHIDLIYKVKNKSDSQKQYSFKCWLAKTENSSPVAVGEISIIVESWKTKEIKVTLYPTEYYNEYLNDTEYYYFYRGKVDIKSP